jgi:small conductance mechanosensitive channel
VLLSLLLVVWAAPFAQEKEPAENSEQPDTAAAEAPADTIPPDLARARRIVGQMESILDSIASIENKMKGKSAQEKAILAVQARRQFNSFNELQPELSRLLPELYDDGVPIGDLKDRFQTALKAIMDYYVRSLTWWTAEINELRAKRETTDPKDLDDLENEISDARERLDKIFEVQTITLTSADSLGLDTREEWKNLEHALKERAETLVGRLQIAVKARSQIEKSVKDEERAGTKGADLGTQKIRLEIAKRRVTGIARSLESTTDLLAKRGYDTAEYRQFAIKTTGEITKRILDPKVFVGLVKDGVEGLWEWFKDSAPNLFVKLVIIVIFAVVFRLAFQLVWWILRIVRVVRLSRLMTGVVGGILNPVATILGILTGLWFVGVNPTTLLAGVGVLGVVVGLALQDTLANLAAGFFILVTQPFDVDDVVVGGGVLGTVRTMGLANTTIVTFDGRRLLVPNRKIWGEVIENRSAEYIRRVDITVKIGYDENVDNALEILRDVALSDDRVLESPEPLIFVSELADSWVEIAVRPWVRNKDWWPLLTDLPRLVRNRFAEEGIDIPIPRRDVAVAGEHSGASGRPDDRPKKSEGPAPKQE